MFVPPMSTASTASNALNLQVGARWTEPNRSA
jgi:hypothetical protein